MPTIRQLAFDANGNAYWLPWEQAIPGEPKRTAQPSISGTVAPGRTVTAVSGTYTGTPTPTISRRWELLDGAGTVTDRGEGDSYAIPTWAATGKVRLIETARGLAGLAVEGAAEAAVGAITGLPVFTRAPVISGLGVVGQILTCVDGAATGSPAPVLTRKWQRDGADISGATGTTYTLVSGDVGKAITCVNIATNTISGTVYTATSASASITPVAAVAPAFDSTPSISGSSTVGSELTATDGTATGAPAPTITGQWLRDGAAISGQTGGSYTTVTADIGKAITYRNTAANGVSPNATATSGAITVVALPGVVPSFTRAPAISGNTAMGQMLTCVDGAATGTPTPTITRQWLRDGTAISGATGLTYTTVSADIGKAISCRNTATNTAGSETSTSGTITVVAAGVAPTFTVDPTISYNATAGKFTCAGGTVAGNPAPSLTYLWHWADTATGTLTARAGGATATPSEWTPDVNTYGGKHIACQVTATNGVSPDAVKMTSRILRPAQEGFIDGTPALTGSSVRGNTLTVGSFTYYGAPTVSYEWYRTTSAGVSTKLSTATATRTTGADDVGNTLTCKVILAYPSNATFDATSNGVTVTEADTPSGTVVSTVAQLITAVNNAANGDTILMAPGNYGAINLTGKTKGGAAESTWVTIRPQDRTNPPAIRGTFDMDDSKGFIIDGLFFDGSTRREVEGESYTYDKVVNGKTTYITIEWQKQKTDEFPDGAMIASRSNKGISGIGIENVKIVDCYFSYMHEGIQIRQATNVEICYNTHAYFNMDPCRVYGPNTDVNVHHNVSHKSLIYTPLHLDDKDRHPDAICQMALNTGSDGGSTNRCKINNNYCRVTQKNSLDNTGSSLISCHSILVMNRQVRPKAKDGAGVAFSSSTAHNNIEIKGNHIVNVQTNGIGIEGFRNSEVSGNLLMRAVGTSTDGNKNPQINIYNDSYVGLVVSNNVNPINTRPAPVSEQDYWYGNLSDSAVKVTNYTKNNSSQSLRPSDFVERVPSNAAELTNGAKPAVPTGNCGQYAPR